MNPIQTIREALEAMSDGKCPETMKVALTALAEIERTHYTAEDVADASAKGFRAGVASVTAGQEPVALIVRNCCEAEKADPDHPDTICISVQDLTSILEQCAAPVAQQPRQCGLCGSDEAFTGTCGGGRRDPRALCYEPVAQQPQTEAVPQRQVTKREHNVLMRALVRGSKKVEAPQQAEVVPPTHVLVPVEPTDAMLIAGGNDAEFCMCCGYDNGPGDCGSIWEAMIAAAQGEKP